MMSICMYINNIVYVHTYFKLYTCVWCNSYMFPTCLCQNLCACWVDFLLIHGSRRLPMMAACRGWKMFHKKYGSHGSKLRTLGTRDLLGPCESYSPLKKGYPNFTAICCCKKPHWGWSRQSQNPRHVTSSFQIWPIAMWIRIHWRQSVLFAHRTWYISTRTRQTIKDHRDVA